MGGGEDCGKTEEGAGRRAEPRELLRDAARREFNQARAAPKNISSGLPPPPREGRDIPSPPSLSLILMSSTRCVLLRNKFHCRLDVHLGIEDNNGG